jgi:GAF domain-containing protein
VDHPDGDQPNGAAIQRALAELGALPFADHSLESLLREVVRLTAGLVPVDAAASVTVVSDGRPATLAASDDIAMELDEVQYRLGAGPCLEAATAGVLVEAPDLAADGRWPGFSRPASERGCQGIVSAPFPATPGPGRVTGGLNVYVRSARAWDEEARRLAARFLEQAATPVLNRHLYELALARAEHLQTAMASRAAIEQAKGILMERFKLSADQAFQALARASMAANTKLRDVADQVVETGEFPVG